MRAILRTQDQRLPAGVRRLDLTARELEQHCQRICAIAVVVDDQHARIVQRLGRFQSGQGRVLRGFGRRAGSR